MILINFNLVNKRYSEGRTSRNQNQYATDIQKSPLSTTREQRLRQVAMTKQPSMKNTGNIKLPSHHATNNSVEFTNAEVTNLRSQEPQLAYNGNASRNQNGNLNVNRSVDSHNFANKNRRQMLENTNIGSREGSKYSGRSWKKEKDHVPPCPYAANITPSPYNNVGLPANNGAFSKSLDHRTSMTEEKKVRPLPLHTKEDVFDEWAAIVRYQDEIDNKIHKDNYEKKMKLRQATYKLELDKQYKELQDKKKGYLGQQHK